MRPSCSPSSDEESVSCFNLIPHVYNAFLISTAVYVFVGCIILEYNVLRIIAGSLIGIVGLGYCVLEYIPSIEPPANMREDGGDPGWGAEQV